MKNIKKIINLCLLLLIFLVPKGIKAYNFSAGVAEPIDQERQALLRDLEDSWPSGMDEGRIELLKNAASLIGKDYYYDWGGGHVLCPPGSKLPKGLDCSGYVSWMFGITGMESICGYTTGAFAVSEHFTQINEEDLVPGDIGLNHGGQGADNHVGIYAGKVNGEEIWFHSSEIAGVSGPQVGYRNNGIYFTFYMRYNKWNEANINFSSTGNDGIGGKIGGSVEDKYKNLPSVSTKNDYTCENIFYYKNEDGALEPKKFKNILDGVFNVIKIAAPTIAIVLSIIDYVKMTLQYKLDDMKKVNKRTITRIAIGILIMMLPYIIDLVFNLFGLYDIKTCNIG